MWTVKQDYHADGCISVLGTDEVPVVVALAGRYPQCVSEDGRDTNDCPHVLITIYNGYDGQRFYNGVVVEAVGEWAGSRRRVLAVYSDVDHGGSRTAGHDTPDAWVEAGLAWVDAAKRALAGMDERYAAAEQVVGRARAYARPLSRGEYEAACATCAVAPLSDDECMGYGVRYGDFSFPEYSAEYVLTMRLARLRQQRLDAERDAPMPAPPTTVPGKSGQLWEPCERCGREPVYMPLNLCDACWPRGASA